MRNLLIISSLAICLAVGIFSSPRDARAQIPVTDVANLAQAALDYLESLAQTLQMYIDYELEYEEMVQVYLEWEATLYRIMSLAERFGADPFAAALEQLEREWGRGPISSTLNAPANDGFIVLSIGILQGVLGGGPMESEQITSLTEFIQNEDTRQGIAKRLEMYSERDLALRDTMLGASAVNERLIIYKERMDELIAQAGSLGGNSDTATLQFMALSQLFSAQQNMEQLELLSKIYGTSHQATLMENMDYLQALKLDTEKRMKAEEEYRVGVFNRREER